MAKPKMIDIKTTSGFELKIDPQIANDMEIIDEFTAIATGTANFVPADFVIKIIGQENKEALYEHCRNEAGRVEATKIGKELSDIFNEASKALKKTLP